MVVNSYIAWILGIIFGAPVLAGLFLLILILVDRDL